ncbi:MAG: tryptophan--tRNA ligase, partial [Terrimicrobiaceae bacterium]
STVTPMGLLERCHSYKDKTARGFTASHGLFAYPVLMAADILIYDSDLVPVGRDQKQHLEVARDIVVKMNETFGEVFKLPQPSIREDTAIVPGLDGAKMSKSYGNTIEIFAPENVLKKKVMGIKTDSTPVDQPKPVEGSSILGLYKLVATEADYRAMEADFLQGGVGYGDLKKRLFAGIWEYFAAPRARREEILADPALIDTILAEGAVKARGISDSVMTRVRKAVGL